MARPRRRASRARPQRQGRRYPDPGPPPRSVHHAHDPRAEAPRCAGRRRRPHEADRSDSPCRTSWRSPTCCSCRRTIWRSPSCSRARFSASTTMILFALAHGRSGSLWSALRAKAKDDPRFAEAADRLSQVACASRLSAALRILLRIARRRRAAFAQAACSRASGRRRRRRSTSFSISRSPMTARPRLHCKASSTSFAPATWRSSATWSRSATRFAS